MSAQTTTHTTQERPDVKQLAANVLYRAEALMEAAERLLIAARWHQEARERTERAARDDQRWDAVMEEVA